MSGPEALPVGLGLADSRGSGMRSSKVTKYDSLWIAVDMFPPETLACWGGFTCIGARWCKMVQVILISYDIIFYIIYFMLVYDDFRCAYIYIYMIPVRGSLPPPPHGMVPKPAFCSILHENVVFAVFLARWVAGAVHKPANS